MIEKMNQFTVTILCTMMFLILIKMILPEGKNKKYILFVCGLVITLMMIEPILQLLHLDINEVFAKNQLQYEETMLDTQLYQEAVQQSYEEKMVEDITNRLRENGYEVSHVQIEYDKNTYQIQKIYLNIEDAEGYVQPVKIEVSQSNNVEYNLETKLRIQSILHSQYGINPQNIIWEKGREKYGKTIR